MSRNWRTPTPAARNRTAWPRNARFSRAPVRVLGAAAIIFPAVSRSAAK
jgi:hypothetical protein